LCNVLKCRSLLSKNVFFLARCRFLGKFNFFLAFAYGTIACEYAALMMTRMAFFVGYRLCDGRCLAKKNLITTMAPRDANGRALTPRNVKSPLQNFSKYNFFLAFAYRAAECLHDGSAAAR
jgi:hypothetical protein